MTLSKLPRARAAPGRTSRQAHTGRANGQASGRDNVSTTIAAGLNAALVALIGVAIALIVTVGSWALSPHTSDTGPDVAARMAVGLWLYAHHVPIAIGEVHLALVPLGLLLLPGVLTYAGGRQLARTTRPTTLADLTRTVIPFALVYGLLAAVIAASVRSPDLSVSPLAAFIGASLVAFGGAGFGLLRAARLQTVLVNAIARPFRDVLAAAAAALATLLTVSAVLTAIALAVAFPDAVEAFRSLGGGWAGGPLLVLLTLAFVPNLVLWTAAFTTGVGFPLGVGGTVGPQGIHYGALPVFPPLTAVPPEGHPGLWAFLTLLAPLLGGCAAALVLSRRTTGFRVEHQTMLAVAGAAMAGLGLGVLTHLASGAVGDAALAVVGPRGWQVALVGALEMSLVAAVVAWEADRRRGTGRPQVIDLRDRLPSLRGLKERLQRR